MRGPEAKAVCQTILTSGEGSSCSAKSLMDYCQVPNFEGHSRIWPGFTCLFSCSRSISSSQMYNLFLTSMVIDLKAHR